MKNKQRAKRAVKKIKSAAKSAAKKTGIFLGKAHKNATTAAKALRKEWKKQRPQREQSIKDFKRIGGDVIATIRKDVNEIHARKSKKK